MSQSDSPRRREDDQHRQLDELLLQVVDAGLAGCIFLVPLLMGGRQAVGQLALAALAALVAVTWMVRQVLRPQPVWRHTLAFWLLAAGVVLLLVQLAPLPPAALAWMAPRTAEILPLWGPQADPAAALGSWSCISLTPGETRAALTVLLAYGLLFFVTVQRIRALEDVERLLRWIALSVLTMAGFGLVQLLTSNGKFFWFYEHPFSDTSSVAKGSFTNRNHFAHFLALGIGPLIWWLQSDFAARRRRSSEASSQTTHRRSTELIGASQSAGYRAVGLGMVLFAGLLSLSRGGVTAMFIAAAVTVAVCFRAKTLAARFVLSLAAAGVLIAALLAIGGHEEVGTRLDSLRSGSLEKIDSQAGRRTIWATVAKAIPDYPLFGAGVGSHVEVYPMYLEQSPGREYTHAENCPLQVTLEAGTIALAMVVLGLGFCAFWCVDTLRIAQSARMSVCVGAIAAGLLVSALHALGDFVWYVPGCMVVVVVLAAAACRSWQLTAVSAGRQIRPAAMPKPVAAALVLLLLAMGTWMVVGRLGPTLAEPHWDRYRIMERAAAHHKPADQQQPQQTPADRYQVDEVSLEAVRRMAAELEKVVAQNPDHARAHLRLAAAYLRWFDLAQQGAVNAMPLAQIRDAATEARRAARGPQQAQQVETWLAQTVSEYRHQLDLALDHTRRGLALCPLQGEGYLYLAELRFLEGPIPQRTKPAYIDQALKVRPFHGAVLFEAGREAWLAGRPQLGLDLWKRSFKCSSKDRRRMMQSLAGRLPVGFLVEQFQPDVHALRWLHARCQELNNPEQISEVRRHLARLTRAEAKKADGKDSVNRWLETLWLYKELDDRQSALASAREALRQHPSEYVIRYALAQCLIRLEQFVEAEEQLNWCLTRRPSDDKLRTLARSVVRKRLDNEDYVRQTSAPARPLR